MKITIEATPEEVKELLQAIGSSKEQIDIQAILGKKVVTTINKFFH